MWTNKRIAVVYGAVGGSFLLGALLTTGGRIGYSPKYGPLQVVLLVFGAAYLWVARHLWRLDRTSSPAESGDQAEGAEEGS